MSLVIFSQQYEIVEQNVVVVLTVAVILILLFCQVCCCEWQILVISFLLGKVILSHCGMMKQCKGDEFAEFRDLKCTLFYH